MKSPKISVVIPSYNKVKFIGKTLESIVSQNYENLEVIIQDGGSTDGTERIIKDYVRKYPSLIKWESKKDKGQCDAVNKGMQKTTGDIVTFINADDVYKSGAFSIVAETFSNFPNALWYAGRSMVINENGKEVAKLITLYKNLLLRLNVPSLLLITNYLMQPSVFLTSKAYRKHGHFIGTSDFLTEYDMWLKLARSEMPVVINKTLTKFRIEPSTKTKRLFKDLLAEDGRIVRRYTGNPLILFLHHLHNLGRMLVGRFV